MKLNFRNFDGGGARLRRTRRRRTHRAARVNHTDAAASRGRRECLERRFRDDAVITDGRTGHQRRWLARRRTRETPTGGRVCRDRKLC